jgi:hypothetical protein
MYRLGHCVDDQWVEHSHPSVFCCHTSPSGTPRIKLGVPRSDPGVVLKLAHCLQPPLFLLYVLHTPRGEADPGRYQSPELPFAEVQDFFKEFSPFLTGDGRFDLWLYSPSQGATLAWDRHNLLYGYGPIECYRAALEAQGFVEGELPAIPDHTHHYRPELDSYAKAVISRYHWLQSPLRPEDEQ